MNREVYIYRGPSGSGKSTGVKELQAELAVPAIVCSADNFHMKPVYDIEDNEIGEEYQFNPALIGQAHAKCLSDFIEAATFGHNTIVVDNTNIHLWEFENYITLAGEFGYEVHVIRYDPVTIGGLKICIERNAHGVPPEIIAKMALAIEPYEGEEVEIIKIPAKAAEHISEF